LLIFRKLYDLVYRFVDGKYYQMPYFEGKIMAIPTYVMGKQIFSVGAYEPEISNLIRDYINKGFSMIDVGSNIGLHILAAAFLKKDMKQKFIAFEPEKNTYEILKRNCEINNLDFIELEQLGIGDIQCTKQINVSTTRNQGIHSFIDRKGTIPGNEVSITTLDHYFLDLKLKNKIVLKIDVEGYEIPVLLGGINWFQQCDNLIIICEVSINSTNQWPKFSKLINRLFHIGFASQFVINDATLSDEGLVYSETFNFVLSKGKIAERMLLNQAHAELIKFADFKKLNFPNKV
ncbi:FkbM family methyltransferase, partial [Chloroflexota bacterium]